MTSEVSSMAQKSGHGFGLITLSNVVEEQKFRHLVILSSSRVTWYTFWLVKVKIKVDPWSQVQVNASQAMTRAMEVKLRISWLLPSQWCLSIFSNSIWSEDIDERLWWPKLTPVTSVVTSPTVKNATIRYLQNHDNNVYYKKIECVWVSIISLML